MIRYVSAVPKFVPLRPVQSLLYNVLVLIVVSIILYFKKYFRRFLWLYEYYTNKFKDTEEWGAFTMANRYYKHQLGAIAAN